MIIDGKVNLTRRFVGWVVKAASRVGRRISPATPISALPAKSRSRRRVLGLSRSRKRTRRSRVVCILSLIPLSGVCLRLEGGSRPTVQAFVETHHRVSQSSGHLQDHTDATKLGQIQRIPVRCVVTLIKKPNLHMSPNFRDFVEARGNFTAVNRPPGNENRRWHGTRRKCTLGDKGCTTFCSDAQCSLCSIVKTSYDLAHFGKKTSWGRFGAGIYTSSTSSKFVSRFFFPSGAGFFLLMTILGI